MGYDDDMIRRMREFDRIRDQTRALDRVHDQARELERIRSAIGTNWIAEAMGPVQSVASSIAEALASPPPIASDSLLKVLAASAPSAMSSTSIAQTFGSIGLLREIESQAALSSRSFDASAFRTLKTEAALFAEQQRELRGIPWAAFGEATRFGGVAFYGLGSSFTDFVGTYHSLMERVSEDERLAASHPTLLWTAPHLEVRASAFALDAVLPRPRWQDDGYEERSYDLDGEASLEELLSELGRDFARTWRGATQSLQSRNADRQRHVSTSIRELLTHVLHTLAPDERVRAWSSDPEHYHNNRPKRSARLRYICRRIDEGKFAAFVRADVKSGDEFLQLLQPGTHALAEPFSEVQVRAIVARAGSLLRYLLLIERSTNSN